MASRGAFGFRSAKQTENQPESREKVPAGLSRKSSITSTASSASKLPSQSTSFFSRSKSRNRADATGSKITPALSNTGGSMQGSVNVGGSKSEPGTTRTTDQLRSAGLGISTLTQVTAAPAPKSGKQTRNVLRRKAPLDTHGKYARTESSASSYELAPTRPSREIASTPEMYSDPHAGSVLGITMPKISATPDPYMQTRMGPSSEFATSSSRMANFNTRKAPLPSSTTPIQPPLNSSFIHDSGSSTRRSESPGNFSRTSTPTSMSSQSPGLGTPAKAPLRRPSSPTRSRPPVTRRKFPPEENNPSQSKGLTAVRESATSSSSSSTIKASEQRRDGSQARSDRSTPLPPSPPVRQSSKRVPRRDEPSQKQETTIDVPERDVRATTDVKSPQSEITPAQTETTSLSRFRSPPPRPSREGTPRLDDAFEPAPVIRTRLPPLQTSGHRRRLSSEKDISSADSKSSTPYSGHSGLIRSTSNASVASLKPTLMPSPNPLVARPLRAEFREQARSRTAPPVDTSVSGTRFIKEPSPLSASPNKSSRFGLFSKRTKSPLEITPNEVGEKALKKGPAAGTGHEGYGKYARRGRSGSTSTSASRGRSTSTASGGHTASSRKSSFTSRDASMDDFLSARLAPVVIPGGGRPTDSPFHGSAHYPTSSADSSAAMTSSEDLSFGDPSVSQPPSAILTSEASSGTRHLRRDYRRLPQRQGISENTIRQQHQESQELGQSAPTLAARRSAQRSQLFGQKAQQPRFPAPIDVRARTASPAMDSRDTAQSSIRTDISDDFSEGREGNWLKSRKAEKRLKSPRKWNFFQRAQASPRKFDESSVPKFDESQGSVREVPATVSRVPESRPVPFYALLEGSDQEGLDPISVAGISQPGYDSSAINTSSGSPETPQTREHRLSSLLPSPPKLTAEFENLSAPPAAVPPPQASFEPEPAPPPPEPKKPRLQQVGRIPRVVSKRDRPHNPPPQSFSRPFARQLAVTDGAVASSAEQREPEARAKPPLGIQTAVLPSDPWVSQDSAVPASAPVRASEPFSGVPKDEFLSFPQKHGSQVSGVSGSSSSGILSYAATTAVVPGPGTAPEEDEIWNEYNDFLDTVGSSPMRLSNESRDPYDKTIQRSRLAPSPLQFTKEASVTSSPERPKPANLPLSSAPTRPLPSPPDRSKLLSADFPSSPGTISDLLAGYEDRNRSSGVSQRKSGYTASRYSNSSIESEAMSFTAGEDEITGPALTGKTSEPASRINLRFTALMTSKWLSADRVLLSPAHSELKNGRVLVIDGLGGDDWSFYCAETYKAASIFSLTPNPSRPQQQSAALQAPKNHRQVRLANLADHFPFPPDSFAVVVLRFPAATSESAYLNAITESMRVLRPGGYLETSILDLDMVLMGNKARKALRELKVRMQVAHPGVSLTPLSDNIQKMMKQRGFENLQRADITLPVAGVVSTSRSNSIDAKSGSIEDLRGEARSKGVGGLAKTLPEVGRWWFTRCYEIITMPYDDMERSIWNDQALLEECEKKETGFKLLLCYAHKPTSTKNGTGSPPKASAHPRAGRL
ncbi:hypothetical protein ACLMJK_006529 [Lecanora helva]